MKNKVFTLVFVFLAMAGNAIWGQSGPTEINITGIESQLPTPSSGTGWTLSHGDIASEGNKLIISKNGNYIISDNADGASDNSNIQIIVNGNLDNVFITVKNVKTNAQLNNNLDGESREEKYNNRCAFEIGKGSKVTLSWEGENKFWSSPERAGINVKLGATLILAGPDTGEDSLEAGSLCNTNDSHTYGAGIGGDSTDPNFGTIIIESGNIKARCESKGTKVDAYAAGIGGGYPKETSGKTSSEGTIIIKGGTVHAASWSNDKGEVYNETNGNGNEFAYGAGIGGGMGGKVDNIIILGGDIKAYSTQGDDIGTGYMYTGATQEHPNIIIGNAEKEGNTTVETIDEKTLEVDNDNYLDGLSKNPSVVGNVTMLDGLQIYVEDLEIKDGATFKAYNVNLQRTLLGEGHTINGWEEGAEDIKNYYLGPNASIETGVLTCQGGDLFLGWYKSENDVVTIENNKTTFKAPTTLSEYIQATYYAVWVESEHPIVVETETTWTKDGDVTPSINYVPKEANDVLNALSFKFETISAPALINWKFEENQILGTTQLQENDTYQEITVKAKVKLGEGEAKEINIPVYIVEKSIINTVSVNTNQSHIYTGLNHNGSEMNEQNHLLNVQMTKNLDDSEVNPPLTLNEGTHYRIYSYSFKGETVKNDADEKSVELINAGEYSDITIEALNATISGDLIPEHGDKYTIQNQTVSIAPRPLAITISFDKESIEKDEVLTWNDVTVDIEAFNVSNNSGLVQGEDIKVSGTIDYQLNEEETQATVTIKDIKIEDGTTFKLSNYKIEINNHSAIYPNDDVEIEKTIPVVTSPEYSDRPGHIDRPKKYYHIYIDTVCPGLQLELSKDSVIEGGQVSVYLTVEEKCDTTGFTFEYKRGLKKWWQDLKPLEGVQPGEYIIKNIYSDIYIQALDAILEIEEEPTGIEDVEGAKVYAKEGTIYVYTPNHERVMIVSMNGAIVKSAEQEGMQSYSLNRGIYIVRIGDKVFKIKN